MASESGQDADVNNVHLHMWNHYDTLRQQKNGTFLTANIFLAGIATFGLKDARGIVWAISLVGIAIEVAWLLMLTRTEPPTG